ncbi:M24 family metallopeptidase, partial [Streptomyces sp. NPDC006129]
MVELKTDTSIDAMYEAGQVVARALTAARKAAGVGVSLLELDEVAHDVLREAGATSPFLGYRPSFAPTPFPAVLCVSVNDAIVHGIPTRYRLRDGDLVSIDFGAELGGWVGDSALSFIVGTPREADLRLIETAERALAAGIEA